ncbi:hypothetical protein FAM09_03265 [Niastella caeni]|uniref:Beta-lactamase-inhibitor-like PepSY-like domain-containing protein n=1 Tax=Niastella caeni TaxID=2569763 RepID=A0A4S8HZ76_9BACT|nr:hypothetical protein [Niastella caeni]THU41148.1 hypothetical protein FAM09_03265 [Niastella caeni]
MKKLFIMFSALLLSFSLIARDPGPGEIDEKLIKTFTTSFPKAERVHWYELPKAWVVNFVAEGVRSRIVYLKDGRITEFTRYYTEANLPFLIRSKIKNTYPKKNIFGVVEVTLISETGASRVEYFVKLEDEKSWMTVKSDNEGNLNIEEKYKKAQ